MIWLYVYFLVIEFVDWLVDYVFGDLNCVFFFIGGGEVVEIVFKFVKYYWKL